MSKRITMEGIVAHRKKRGENQLTFWRRYGVSQTASSRYEDDRLPPQPVAILIWLHQNGELSDTQLERARKATEGFIRERPAARGAAKR